jgi:bla regulator protein BlaR1
VNISLFHGRKLLLAAACLAIFATPCRSQTQQPAIAEFEVASIKPSDPAARGGSIQPGGQRFTASNMPLVGLICFAWDVRDDQLSGVPGWILSQRYDVVAKSGNSGTDPRQFLDLQRRSLQNLLADRFQLKVHRENRERPVYVLTVDKRGLKMKENNDLTSDPAPAIRITGKGQATAQIVSTAYMAQFLTWLLGRTVLDQTGLKSNYDFKLEWAPDPSFEPQRSQNTDVPMPADSSGPSIFSALQQQLGLKLESTKGPVEIIVIDHVEKPSEN